MIEIQILIKTIYNIKTGVHLDNIVYKPPVTLILDSLDNLEYYRQKEEATISKLLSLSEEDKNDFKVMFAYKDLTHGTITNNTVPILPTNTKT